MSFLPDDLPISSDGAPWPGSLAGPGGAELRERVNLALGTLPEDVRDQLVGWLGGPQPQRARWMLLGLAEAGRAGHKVLRQGPEGFVMLADPEGREFAMAALAFATPAHHRGAPEDLARLLDTLDATFRDRRWLLYLRRPIAAGYEPGPVGRAVFLWLAAIDKGEWQGRHAVYEDEGLSCEFTVLEGPPGKGATRMLAGPVNSLEHLGVVDHQLVELVKVADEFLLDTPFVAVLGADRGWRLSRGFTEQLFYGTAAELLVEEGRYEARFLGRGSSVFADNRACRMVSAWWFEPGVGDPLVSRSWALENPWADCDWTPAFNGRSFAILDRDTGTGKVRMGFRP